MLIIGKRWSMLTSEDARPALRMPAAFDRQVRAFGGDVQRVLSQLRVGVVGCGGTGSAATEQLVRLGIRQMVLVDPDVLSESNITRVYGSAAADVGKHKVDVLLAHVRRIAPDLDVTTCIAKVTEEHVARSLTGCDIVFGCTDDNAGRLVAARLAAYYLLPLIDCGVLISSEHGQLQGVDGRVTVVTPGEGCLVCRGRIDMAQAQAEQLHPTERAGREAEGYARSWRVLNLLSCRIRRWSRASR